jgi:hypothetical protein
MLRADLSTVGVSMLLADLEIVFRGTISGALPGIGAGACGVGDGCVSRRGAAREVIDRTV